MKEKIKILLIIIFIAFIGSLIIIHSVGKKVNSTISEYSLNEAERFGTYMINYSIDKEFINQFDDKIFYTKKNTDDEIQLIEMDPKKVNFLLEEATTKIQRNLIKLENGDIKEFDLSDSLQGLRFKGIKKGVVCELPKGIIFNNALFSNIGSVIPIKLNFIGQVTSNIKTKLENYGINNVYIEVYLHIEVSQRVTMPLKTEDIVVETDIPLAIKVIQGTIPNYYQNPIINDSSQFSLPIS